MIKRIIATTLALSVFALSGCGKTNEIQINGETTDILQSETVIVTEGETRISLSQDAVTVNGEMLSADAQNAVYGANDIIYYESGKDASYGEGTESDAHTYEEASKHLVIHITESGTYRVSGKLENGQIFVDLGDDAKKDPEAVVTLILDNVDITCTVAPAIFFYNVYECGDKDEANATAIVDTSAAGANVIIANGSINTVNGSYVARIYKPGTTDKLHKYDGAFYSKRSMNIFDEGNGTGVLNIVAENEGLDSEMHLTINGGNISITSQNDGINTNEDNISVTTVNGGALTINAGLGEEGDGIDSNGFIVINGGSILTSSCDKGADGGIDADRDILINGGIVMACGNNNGAVSSESKQGFLQIAMQGNVPANAKVKLLDGENTIIEFTTVKSASAFVLSTTGIDASKPYTVTVNGAEQRYSAGGAFGPEMGGMGGMQPPMGEDFQRPDGFGGFRSNKLPEGLDEWLASADIPDEIREWIESIRDMAQRNENRGEIPDNISPEDIQRQ